jgi:hypothetical protein
MVLVHWGGRRDKGPQWQVAKTEKWWLLLRLALR